MPLVTIRFSRLISLVAILALCCRSAAEEPSPAAPVLRLANGDFVPGALAESDVPDTLRWQGAAFTSPFEFSLESVHGAEFPANVALAPPQGDYRLELSGGDILYGLLVGLDAAEVVFDEARLGRVRLHRQAVERIDRLQGNAALVYLGPNGTDGWKEAHSGRRWREDSGHLLSDQEGASISGNFGLPAQAYVEFEISWTQKPDFVFALGVSSLAKSFRFEVWDRDLVVLRETDQQADLASVMELPDGAGRLHLLAYLDQEKERIQVFTSGGKQLAELQVSSDQPKVAGSVRLINKHGDVRLERLRIGRWSGEPPREVQADKSRLTRLDGSAVYGQVSGFDAATRAFVVRGEQGETRVPADQVESVFLSPPQEAPAAEVRLAYFDGARLSGELLGIEAAHARLASPAADEPLRLPLAGLRSLTVPPREAKNGSPAGLYGVLETDDLRLRGRLADAAGGPEASCLSWQPLASKSASPLRHGASGRIVYREPVRQTPQAEQAPRPTGFVGALVRVFTGDGAKPSPAVPGSLHLRAGDIIPCEVTGIDESGVSFHTAISDAQFVAHDKVQAVELKKATAQKKLAAGKRERLLTLPRLQKHNPPTHLVRSTNGDYLRGRLISLDEKTLRIEVRLEVKELARDRVSRIIWLHPEKSVPPAEAAEAAPPADAAASNDAPPGEATPSNDAAPPDDDAPPAEKAPAEDAPQDVAEADAVPHAEPPPAAAAFAPPAGATRVQALRSDGIRLTLFADRVAGETVLSGVSDVLGPCRVELTAVDQLLIGERIDREAARLAYQKWKLQHAAEPLAASADAGSQDPGADQTGTESPLVGKPAPDFELEMLEGKKFHLSEHKGKVVVLDFWATWCGPCLQTMPQVEEAVKEFQDQGVELVAVNIQETPDEITGTLDRLALDLAVALDQDGKVAEQYAANSIPQTVIVGSDGKVARLYVGGSPRFGEQLQTALKAIVGAAADAARQ